MHQMRFQAALQGINLDKEMEKNIVSPKDNFDGVFKSPKQYMNLPLEERKKVTERMKEKCERFFGSVSSEIKVG